MGFYGNRLLPHLIRLTMRQRQLAPYRARALSAATGRVLEIGIGAGANLPFYGERVHELVGLEPSPQLGAMARRAAGRLALLVTVMAASAETIPLDDASIDTVVMTWTLCSIPAPIAALHEMRRVLKPGGRLLFVEHGLAADPRVQKWQNRLTPCWKHLAGGCHLNRAIGPLIEQGGFQIERLATGYLRGPKPMTFTYEGSAS